LTKTQLKGIVAVSFHSLPLQNHTGSGLHDRNRDAFPVCSKDLGHTQLLTQDSLHHGVFP